MTRISQLVSSGRSVAGRIQTLMTDVVAGVRGALAFVLPAVLGNLLLAFGSLINRRWARNANAWLIGRLGPRLAGFDIAIEGASRALNIRPAVVVFNHQSAIDPVVVARLAGRDSIGVAKASLRRHLLLGPLLRMYGTVFIDADGNNRGALIAAAERIRTESLAVLMTPEGTRSLSLRRFHRGAVHLAAAAQAPIVPLVIHDSGAILPPRGLLMRPGRVRVTVLPAQPPDSITTLQLQQLFRDALADAV